MRGRWQKIARHRWQGRPGCGGVRRAVSAGVAERPDGVQEFHERPRPAVEQEQRRGVRLRRLHVQEVDPLAVDLGYVLRIGVQPRFGRPPVEAVTPVLGELTQVVDGHAALPPGPGQAGRPPGPAQAVGKVVQVRLRDVDPEFFDLGCGRAGHCQGLRDSLI